MKLYIKLCLFLSLLFLIVQPFSVYAQDKKPTIIFDLDDTVALRNAIPPFSKFSAFAWNTCTYINPKHMLYILWNIKTITQKGKEFSKEQDATLETVLKKMTIWLKDNGYGGFNYIALAPIIINPRPIIPIIHLIKQLKKDGYTIVAATGHDGLNHKCWCEYLKKWYNIDCDELFDIRFTSFSEYVSQQPTTNQLSKGAYQVSDTFFMAPQGTNKPKHLYFESLYQIMKDKGFNVEKFVFIDDTKHYVEGFQQFLKQKNIPGVGILFTSPKKSTREQQVEADDIKDQIEKFTEAHIKEVQIANPLANLKCIIV